MALFKHVEPMQGPRRWVSRPVSHPIFLVIARVGREIDPQDEPVSTVEGLYFGWCGSVCTCYATTLEKEIKKGAILAPVSDAAQAWVFWPSLATCVAPVILTCERLCCITKHFGSAFAK